MCGIAGIIDINDDLPDHTLLERMGDIIAHRGPDDSGIYLEHGIGLIHRRLSIIDLSPKGHQPMCNEDGTIWIVFNGEIYNYAQLTVSLSNCGHMFKSNTDTEVIIHAYEQFGIECVQHLNGMFAFALWDSRNKRLFAARDRLGIKPLYYYYNGKQLIFGSEIKAILCCPNVQSVPNLDAIKQYLLFGHSYDDSTWYTGIRKLEPGSYLVLEHGELTLHKYWDVIFDIDYSRSSELFEEELQTILADSVRLHFRSDVPVGAYLSGGIDSSSIVALIANESKESMHTFSSAYSEGKEYDERKYINIVSKKFSTQHHEVIPSYVDIPNLLKRIIWHLDEPVIGAAVLPMYRVCEMVASSGVKVVNGGQGADELFGGYPPYFALAARNLLDGILGRGELGPIMEYAQIPQYLVKGGVFNRLWNRITPNGVQMSWLKGTNNIRDSQIEHLQFVKDLQPYLQPLEMASYLQIKNYLPGLLHQEDRMSMAWSVESRVPFLDYRIVELAAKIPSWLKVRNGTSKYILRRAMRGITPSAILERKDKKGYPVPTSKWFNRELRAYIKKTLVDAPLMSADIIDQSAVAQMVQAHISGKQDFGGTLWLILNTEIWFQCLGNGI